MSNCARRLAKRIGYLVVGLFIGCIPLGWATPALAAQSLLSEVQQHWQSQTEGLAPLLSPLTSHITLQGAEPVPLWRQMRAEPLTTPAQLWAWGEGLPVAAAPYAWVQWATHTLGVGVARPLKARELGPANGDALVLAMVELQRAAHAGAVLESEWPVPTREALPEPLRGTVAELLRRIALAEQFRQRALAQLPGALDVDRLIAQLGATEAELFAEPDLRLWVSKIEYAALAAGFQELTAAVQEWVRIVQNDCDHWPAQALRFATPLGEVIIDTRPNNTQHRYAEPPLLLIDTQGHDHYVFQRTTGQAARGRIQVLVDLAGNDQYVSLDPAAGPGAGVLGYGVLWDGGGRDQHAGERLTQAAALFGAALLVNEGEGAEFVAQDFSQGFALAGWAVLHSGAENDVYRALSFSQASAGPWAVAALVDAGGNDHYVLADTPLKRASAQLPDRNVSMGQGAGWGWRADREDGRSLPGGVAVLVDESGEDRYQAAVFAQGAGYWQGLGVLVDREGNDHYHSAWYGMGAAAHHGLALFMDAGQTPDHYVLTHHAGLGMANDRSVAVFIDAAGEDRYQVADRSQGSVLNHGLAWFVDAQGSAAQPDGGLSHDGMNHLNCEPEEVTLSWKKEGIRLRTPLFCEEGSFTQR